MAVRDAWPFGVGRLLGPKEVLLAAMSIHAHPLVDSREVKKGAVVRLVFTMFSFLNLTSLSGFVA